MIFAGTAFVLAAHPGVASAIPASSSDLWNFDNGSSVTSHSGTLSGNDIRNMFGFVGGSVEPGNTLFRDAQPTGTLHYVEWATTSDVTVRSFVLNAAHDGPPRDANARGFSTFRLFAYDDVSAAFELIFQFAPSNPYGNSAAPPYGIVETDAGLNLLSLGVNIDPVTASKFRAEFVQFGFYASNASGPRVMELDGFDTSLTQAPAPNVAALPEPGSVALLASGLLGLALLRRRPRGSRHSA